MPRAGGKAELVWGPPSVFYNRKRLGVEPLYLLTQEARGEAQLMGDLKSGEKFGSSCHRRFERTAKQDNQVGPTFHLWLVAVALPTLQHPLSMQAQLGHLLEQKSKEIPGLQ